MHKPYFLSLFMLAMCLCFGVFLMAFKAEPVRNSGVNPETHTVTIFRMKFDPAVLTVHKGDTVVWVNKDLFDHDVTEETSRKWTSKPIHQGEKWSTVINEDVKYFCNLHKVMKGSIVLEK